MMLPAKARQGTKPLGQGTGPCACARPELAREDWAGCSEGKGLSVSLSLPPHLLLAALHSSLFSGGDKEALCALQSAPQRETAAQSQRVACAVQWTGLSWKTGAQSVDFSGSISEQLSGSSHLCEQKTVRVCVTAAWRGRPVSGVFCQTCLHTPLYLHSRAACTLLAAARPGEQTGVLDLSHGAH